MRLAVSDRICHARSGVIISGMDEPLEVTVGMLLREQDLRLSVAESCTGGLIGDLITDIPGSSDYFLGGVIAYANQTKVRLLGVKPSTLQEFGAVSRETVMEMAEGARRALDADIGLAVSGIAGPGGGTPEKPVGLIWIGLSAPGFATARRFQLQGDRLEVKAGAAREALQLLAGYLRREVEVEMNEIEVKARFDEQGEAIPLSFRWEDADYRVESVGRRWRDEAGQHVLVMVPGGGVFELLFDPDGVWLLSKKPSGRRFV